MSSLEPAVFTLHRYYIWANRMRTHFDEVLQRKPARTDPAQIEHFLYMSYWYGGLYVVIEGWRKLGLTDPMIDQLLDSPNVDLLRRYRNGTFHFQRDYFSGRFMALITAGEGVVAWVRDLNAHFGRYFLQRITPEKCRTGSEVPDGSNG